MFLTILLCPVKFFLCFLFLDVPVWLSEGRSSGASDLLERIVSEMICYSLMCSR